MIGGDGREYGPVAADQLREWLAEHRANGQTQVRRDGEAEWQAIAAVPEFAEALRDAAPIHQAPPPPPPPALPAVVAAGAGTLGQLEIGSCLGRAWSLLLANLPLIVGGSALVWGLQFLLQLIFCIGPIASVVLAGPLMAGLSLLVLKRTRGQPARVNDVFAFFGPPFMQFMLLGIVYLVATSIGTMLCFVPGLVLMVIWAFAFVAAADRPGHFWAAMETSRRVVLPRFITVATLLLLAWLPVVLVSLYIGVLSGTYASDLFLSGGAFDFQNIDFERVEQFGRYAAGLELKRAVVELLNLPFAVAVTVQAYEDLFGRRPENNAG